jgi:hypothetical protein
MPPLGVVHDEHNYEKYNVTASTLNDKAIFIYSFICGSSNDSGGNNVAYSVER